MIERIESPMGNVVGVRVHGLLRHEDYQHVHEWVDAAAGGEGGGRTNMVVEVEGLKGWTPRAALDDIDFGLRQANQELERLAIVTEQKWLEPLLKIWTPFVRYEMRRFGPDQREEAWRWAAGIEEEPTARGGPSD